VIFITVGTHRQPFDRLLGALGPLAELDDLVVQHGDASAPAEAAVAAPYLSASEVAVYLEQARVAVMHAGVGSFVVASRIGHHPVVVPRLRRYGEHVDDHQAQLARALERHGKAIAVWDVAELAGAVQGASRGPARDASIAGDFHTAVRRALDGDRIATWAPSSYSGEMIQPADPFQNEERVTAPTRRGIIRRRAALRGR
jgi:UDP-N-acetylglucosamine transferase subunit ALG13